MALILHISDLHLSQAEVDEQLGDYKIDVIPAADRVRRTPMIRSSLRSLGRALHDRGDQLDALVVSGDVTYRAADDGFELLAETLSELGDVLPEPEHILVVPGNHDVRWFTLPSSTERYSSFVAGVRRLGYRTPLLEGIDILPDGKLSSTASSPVVLTKDQTVAILGLNTADYCGIEQFPSPQVQEAIDALTERLVDDRATSRSYARIGSRVDGLISLGSVHFSGVGPQSCCGRLWSSCLLPRSASQSCTTNSSQ